MLFFFATKHVRHYYSRRHLNLENYFMNALFIVARLWGTFLFNRQLFLLNSFVANPQWRTGYTLTLIISIVFFSDLYFYVFVCACKTMDTIASRGKILLNSLLLLSLAPCILSETPKLVTSKQHENSEAYDILSTQRGLTSQQCAEKCARTGGCNAYHIGMKADGDHVCEALRLDTQRQTEQEPNWAINAGETRYFVIQNSRCVNLSVTVICDIWIIDRRSATKSSGWTKYLILTCACIMWSLSEFYVFFYEHFTCHCFRWWIRHTRHQANKQPNNYSYESQCNIQSKTETNTARTSQPVWLLSPDHRDEISCVRHASLRRFIRCRREEGLLWFGDRRRGVSWAMFFLNRTGREIL